MNNEEGCRIVGIDRSEEIHIMDFLLILQRQAFV